MSATQTNDVKPQTPTPLFNTIVAVSVAVIALVGSLITKIQGDAATAGGIAGNDEQRYYYQAMGEQIMGDAGTNSEFGTMYQLWQEYNLLAIAAEKGGNAAAAESYRKLRDDLVKGSKLLNSAYFNRVTGEVDLVGYRLETYQQNILRLEEEKQASSEVASAWGAKSSAYILQLTLLAVAGFLLGLSLTTKSQVARLVFAWSGIPMIFIISVWAYIIWRQPVYDLRTTGAIPYYAEGQSLVAQKKWDEAIAKLDAAIELAGDEHPYGRAFLIRAEANAGRMDYAAAIDDYYEALDAGEDDSHVVSDLVWALFQVGKFEEALDEGYYILDITPNDLWLQLRVAMVLLANGDLEESRAQYQTAIEYAKTMVDEKRALHDDVSDIWWQLNQASYLLGRLEKLIDSETAQSPVKDAIKNPDEVKAALREMITLLDETSVTLQYDLETGAADASFDPPRFRFEQLKDKGSVYKIYALSHYKGIPKGSLLVVKVLRNGVEDPSWTRTVIWDHPADGVLNLSLTPNYADLYLVRDGNYEVLFYINGRLIQHGVFQVGAADPDQYEGLFNDLEAYAYDTYYEEDDSYDLDELFTDWDDEDFEDFFYALSSSEFDDEFLTEEEAELIDTFYDELGNLDDVGDEDSVDTSDDADEEDSGSDTSIDSNDDSDDVSSEDDGEDYSDEEDIYLDEDP